MTPFTDKLAVITGGGSGIGRELVRQLAAQGANVAMCDVSMDAMIETRDLCFADGINPKRRITAHVADVSKEDQVLRFRDEVAEQLATDRVHILINNAGIAGGGSLFTDSRANWDRTFGVCWFGVYYSTRAFLPMIVNAESGYIVNVSSACGFWASQGPQTPNTAYSAAKFAVKGFTEALITDLKINAPRVRCAVAMPGHIGTDILLNSRMVLAHRGSAGMPDTTMTPGPVSLGEPDAKVDQPSDAETEAMLAQISAQAKASAPMGPAEAAKIILDGMVQGRWRILVGRDAEELDASVRNDPEAAYDDDFKTPFG